MTFPATRISPGPPGCRHGRPRVKPGDPRPSKRFGSEIDAGIAISAVTICAGDHSATASVIARFGLDPIARPARNERERNDLGRMPESADQPIKTMAGPAS